MDVALYEKLLEELRSDLSQSEPKLAELRTVESFLQRRLGNRSDATSYQQVLDDISADISGEEQAVAELQRVDRFVSRRLEERGVTVATFVPKPVAAPAKPAPVANEPSTPPSQATPTRPIPKPKPKPLPEPEPEFTDETAEEPVPSLASLSNAHASRTIEFGPDGFPINNSLGGSSGKQMPPKEKSDKPIRTAPKPPVSSGSGMDGATINFGPDGFPLDFPKSAGNK